MGPCFAVLPRPVKPEQAFPLHLEITLAQLVDRSDRTLTEGDLTERDAHTYLLRPTS